MGYSVEYPRRGQVPLRYVVVGPDDFDSIAAAWQDTFEVMTVGQVPEDLGRFLGLAVASPSEASPPGAREAGEGAACRLGHSRGRGA